MDDVNKSVKKSQKPIERATINDSLKQKLIDLTEQANGALNGIATVTKSDVINMILEQHSDKLSDREIERLKASHIDQVKLALWLAGEVKNAKRAGEQVSLKELLERCDSIVAGKKIRKPRKKKNGDDIVAPTDSLSQAD